jgi:hypothetical protein
MSEVSRNTRCAARPLSRIDGQWQGRILTVLLVPLIFWFALVALPHILTGAASSGKANPAHSREALLAWSHPAAFSPSFLPEDYLTRQLGLPSVRADSDSVPENGPLRLLAADVEPDGDVDLVTSYFHTPSLWTLWLNNGKGNFTRGPTPITETPVWRNGRPLWFYGFADYAARCAPAAPRYSKAAYSLASSSYTISSPSCVLLSHHQAEAPTSLLPVLTGCLSRRGPPPPSCQA